VFEVPFHGITVGVLPAETSRNRLTGAIQTGGRSAAVVEYLFSVVAARVKERGVYAASAWRDACVVAVLPERRESADREAA
jgi:hypothetical protein